MLIWALGMGNPSVGLVSTRQCIELGFVPELFRTIIVCVGAGSGPPAGVPAHWRNALEGHGLRERRRIFGELGGFLSATGNTLPAGTLNVSELIDRRRL